VLGSIVSSEEAAETGSEEVEEVTAEETEREEGEAPEELAPLEYKLGAPELLEAMLDAFDILERASEGQISLSEAKALFFEKVDEALKKACIGTPTTRARPP